MAKGKSFIEKVRKSAKREKQFSMIKYVKSIVSEKTGQYRFQESMMKVPVGMSLDAYLKQLEEESVITEDSDSEEVEASEGELAEQVLEEAEEPVVDEAADEVKASESQTEE